MSEPIMLTTSRYKDHRGFFGEIYNRKEYRELGIDVDFVQDNHSFSKKVGTIRGLHFQAPPQAQAKLVRCLSGAIFDVVIDIRLDSPNYNKWYGYEISADNGHQLYVPIGFAHGFLTLKPNSEIIYKCSEYYAPQTEGSILWNDPDIGIKWPLNCEPILSDKDATSPLFRDFDSPFIFGVNS